MVETVEQQAPAIERLHLDSDVLEDGGAARIEKIGPVLADELSHLVGHHRITLTPVVCVNDAERAVDAYEIPDWMRESMLGRDRYEVFPSSREARGCDLDHTVPMCRESGARPDPRTSARSPGVRIEARPTAAGSSNSLDRVCSGGSHRGVRSTGSALTAPATSPRETPRAVPHPSND
jgi:hypothetical protein